MGENQEQNKNNGVKKVRTPQVEQNFPGFYKKSVVYYSPGYI